jgi:hypothetical protein
MWRISRSPSATSTRVAQQGQRSGSVFGALRIDAQRCGSPFSSAAPKPLPGIEVAALRTNRGAEACRGLGRGGNLGAVLRDIGVAGGDSVALPRHPDAVSISKYPYWRHSVITLFGHWAGSTETTQNKSDGSYHILAQ